MKLQNISRLWLLLVVVILSLLPAQVSARDSGLPLQSSVYPITRLSLPDRYLTIQEDPAVVHIVIFWLDSCGHCHYVLEEVLPPLREQYGAGLETWLIELKSAEDFDRLYQTAAALGIAKENVFVPFLIIGDQVLIGSARIPAELPGLIEHYLAEGGVGYPDLPPLAGLLPASQGDSAAAQPETGQPVNNGFTLAILILAGMLVSLLYTGVAFIRGAKKPVVSSRNRWRDFIIPLLAITGLGVAGYLAYVETQAVRAVCGPVGDCNAVQASPYARLFGVLPIGILGAIGYALILAFWLWAKFRPGRSGKMAALGIFCMALFGTIFSVYLTYLEPFVIRAVCIWCLSSAVMITLLLLFSVRPALDHWSPEEY